MKIIFLDIDGPLANDLTFMQFGTYQKYDVTSCEILNSICKLSGAKIVITSTNAYNRAECREEIYSSLHQAGLDTKHIHDDWSVRGAAYQDDNRTNGKERSRTNLVKRWMLRHPEMSHSAIIDDDKVGLPNFVEVSSYNGIMAEQFYKVAQYLDFDIGRVFQKAAAERKNIAESQYLLPFGVNEENANGFVAKSFSL